MTAKSVKFIFPDDLDELERIAKNLDKMGKDLMESGVYGYGISLRKEAGIIHSIAEGIQ